MLLALATISPYDCLGLGQSPDGRLGGAPPDYWLAVADAERRQATGFPESWSVLVRGKEAVEQLELFRDR